MIASRNIRLGKFIQDETGTLHGRIFGLGIVSTSLVSETVSSQEGKAYFKLIGDPLGAAYEAGAAFPKEKDGKTYYSVTLESPIFPAPINAALFPDRNEEGVFNLVWSRPETVKPSAEANAGQSQSRRHMSTVTP